MLPFLLFRASRSAFHRFLLFVAHILHIDKRYANSGKEGEVMHRCKASCKVVVEESGKLGVECREGELVVGVKGTCRAS